MIDAIIPLGTGSKSNNDEIKFALRSVDKLCSNVGKIFIVGECPNFLKDIFHIPFIDRKEKNENIMLKVLEAFKRDYISDNSLFMNDDHYFCKPVDIATYPNYYNGTLLEQFGKKKYGDYPQKIDATHKALRAENLPLLFYDIHTPIIYNKHLFNKVARFDWKNSPGMVVKSLYANSNKVEGTKLEDCVIYSNFTIPQIEKAIKDRNVFSSGEYLFPNTKVFLNQMFPNKSRWEK